MSISPASLEKTASVCVLLLRDIVQPGATAAFAHDKTCLSVRLKPDVSKVLSKKSKVGVNRLGCLADGHPTKQPIYLKDEVSSMKRLNASWVECPQQTLFGDT